MLRGQEPPTNDKVKLMRRRVSIDPPSSPEIQLTQRQLELQQRRRTTTHAPPPPPPPQSDDHDENQNPEKTLAMAPNGPSRQTLSESYVHNPFSSLPKEDKSHAVHNKNRRSSMSVNIGRNGEQPSTALSRDQQPFSTRSNKEAVRITKTTALAEKALRKENGSTARSALQLKLLSSSGSLLGGRNAKSKSSGSSQQIGLPHDNTEAAQAQHREKLPAESSTPATTLPCAPPPAASVSTTSEDQREFLRNLLAAKSKPAPSTAKFITSVKTSSTSSMVSNSKMPAASTDPRLLQLSVQPADDGAATLSNLTSSSLSSSSADGKTIIRKVLQKTMNTMKGTSKSKSTHSESPRGKSESAFPRLTSKTAHDGHTVASSMRATITDQVDSHDENRESTAATLSRQVLAEHSMMNDSALSPRSSGLSLKRLIRRKKGSRLKKAESFLFQYRDPPETRGQDNRHVVSAPVECTETEVVALLKAKAAAGILRSEPSGLKDNLVQKTNSMLPKLPTGISEEYLGVTLSETTSTEESSTIMGALPSLSVGDSLQYSHEGVEDGILVYTARSYDTITSGTSSAANSLTSEPNMSHGSVFQPDLGTPRMRQLQNIGDDPRNDEPEGYTQFLEALDLNTSFTHSHLWSSFHSVMSGTRKRFSPKPHENFDSRTEKMITTMNVYLRRTSIVECVKEAQLVNDKKYAKEMEAGIPLGPTPKPKPNSLKETAKTSIASSTPAEKSTLALIIESQAKKKEEEANEHENRPKMLSFSPALTGSTFTDTSTSSAVNTSTDTTSVPPSANVIRIGLDESDMDHTKSTSARRTSEREIVPIQIDDTPSTAVQVEVENVKTKVSNSRHVPVIPKTKLNSDLFQQTKSSDNEIPWANVKLRSVDPDLENSADQTQGRGIPSPWAKLKLRPVLVANSDDQSEQTAEIPVVNPSSTESTASSDHRLGEQLQNSSADLKPENSELVSQGDTRPQTCPSETTTYSEDADDESTTVVFSLRETPGTNSEKQVSVGKKRVMLFSLDGKSKPRVTWSLPRDKIKSMKLDLDSQCVNLLLAGGSSKVLVFQASVDCLNFATAFYEIVKPKQLSDTMDTSVCSDITRDTDGRLEHLNGEEQKVLETYRQVRRTKPLDDAIRASIYTGEHNKPAAPPQAVTVPGKVLDSTVNSIYSCSECQHSVTQQQPLDQQPLSSTEIEDAEMYKKMLRMRIPPEAVLHKMKKDGVDPKLMSFVLGDTGFLRNDSNLSSDFTEYDRKTASLNGSMLKLDVPHDGVHNKLQGDGVSDKILSAILNPNKPQCSPNDLTDAEEAEAAPYRKMLKMMIPDDAVRHKMIRDGIDSKIMAAVVDGENRPAREDSPVRDTKVSEAEEAVAAPYRKMLKMMMPKDAVRHKMISDKVEPKIVKAVVGDDVPRGGSTGLTEDEEAMAATYRKMLKLSLPREAVQHRMRKEGVSEKIIKSVLGDKSTAEINKKGGVGGQGTKGGSKFVSLHWTPLSGTELDNSIWKANKERRGTTSQPEGHDMSKLVELFQKKNNNKTLKNKPSSSDANGKGKAKLLDLSRANNVAISLQAFKDFSHEELADILRFVDPLHKLRGERVQFVRDLLPTAAEVSSIKTYYGSSDRLVPAERWFRNIVHIKRLETKAQVLHTMEIFDSEVSRLTSNLRLLTQTCTQVMESERLRELLEMVLHIGNTLNEGTRTGGADGFKFDSLLRLTQTKSSADGKTTVLDYLVYLYAAKGQRQVLALTRDIPDCQNASRMLMSDLTAEVQSVHDKLEICKKELNALMADQEGKASFLSSNKDGQEIGSGSEARLQMMSAILARGVEDSRETASDTTGRSGSFLKKNEFLAALKAKDAANPNHVPTDVSAVGDILKAVASTKSECPQNLQSVSPRTSLMDSQHQNNEATNQIKGEAISSSTKYQIVAKQCTLQEGITRLEGFVKSAGQKYIALKSDCDLALKTSREMSQYCGESGGERATSTVLGILSEFAESLDKAVAKYDKEQEVEAKRQAKAEKEKGGSSKNAGASPKRARRRPEDLQTDFAASKTKNIKVPPVTSEQAPQPNQIVKATLPPMGCGKSLVILVNEMLKEASEEAKNDFTHGVVYENPDDDKLKAIYEREKRRRSADGDILTTIQKRQVGSGANETAKTRSQLARVVETMNCTPTLDSILEEPVVLEEPIPASDSKENRNEIDKFNDLQRRWSELKASTPKADDPDHRRSFQPRSSTSSGE